MTTDRVHAELVTERLSLRCPAPGDIDTIYRIHHDPLACAHNPADALASRESAAVLFELWDAHWSSYGFGYWTVRRGEEIAGFCGLKFMTFRERTVVNLFYRYAPDFWGQGLASEAASRVVGWADEFLPNCPVIARVHPDNTASGRVAARIGLRRDAELDGPGQDGHELLYTLRWPARAGVSL